MAKTVAQFQVKKLVDVDYVDPTDEDYAGDKHQSNIYIPLNTDGSPLSDEHKLPVVMHVHGGGWKRGL